MLKSFAIGFSALALLTAPVAALADKHDNNGHDNRGNDDRGGRGNDDRGEHHDNGNHYGRDAHDNGRYAPPTVVYVPAPRAEYRPPAYYGRPQPKYRYANQNYYPDAHYRNGSRYQTRYLGPNDRIYRGRDNRYYCRRSDGTTGLIIGGITGGALGSTIAPGGNATLGALLGGSLGAVLGQSIDRGHVSCR